MFLQNFPFKIVLKMFASEDGRNGDRKEGMQDRRKIGHEGCRTEGRQDMRDAGQKEDRT